jgi:hypothetical protein
MTKLRFICIITLELLLAASVMAQEFSDEERSLIASKIDELLSNYQKYGGLSKDGVKISDEYINNVNSLFKGTTDVYIYNDIDPENLMGENITVSEYNFKIRSWYESGLSIRLSWDASLMSEAAPVPDIKHSYKVSLLLEKQVMGVYKSSRIVNNTVDLFFIIEFREKGKAFTDFKIAGIQKEKPVLEVPEEPEVAVKEKKKKREGEGEKEIKKEREEREERLTKYVSVYFNPLYTRIYNKDIFNDEYWTASPGPGYNTGFGITFMPRKSIGVYSGLSLTNYRTDLSLKNYINESNTTLLTDKDNDVYYRYIQADVKENNSLTYFDLSLGVSYIKLNSKESMGLYVNAGCQLSYLFKGKYKISGTSTHMGYYPEYHVILYDLEDYDLTTENLDSEDAWDLSSYNLSGYLSFGLLVKLFRPLSIKAGPMVIYGINDLKYDIAKHRDDYISTIGVPGKTNTQAAGINISFVFKL